MIKPTVHINGTARETLLEGYTMTLSYLRAAMRELEASGPNGRDYYPQGAAAIVEASREHAARLQKLAEVAADLQELAEHVA